MSLTCGFFNSIDHDRRYDARQFSRIFDGIINDGVFMNIGECFIVTAQVVEPTDPTRIIEVGTGRAWFDGTWSLNDAKVPFTIPSSDTVMPRIDAVVLEVNAEDGVRNNSLKIVMGEPTAAPQKPVLINTELVHQHPLCYIARKPNVETITQADITNVVGTEETPFVTGILETISTDELLRQWEVGFGQWMAKQTDDFEDWRTGEKNAYNQWFESVKNDYQIFFGENEADFDAWSKSMEALFRQWFADLNTNLSGDVAGNLQLQITTDEIKRIMIAGFADGVKTISEDGKSIITVAGDGRTLTKTFNDDFLILTSVLTAKEGGIIATQVKEFDSNGSIIRTTLTYT